MTAPRVVAFVLGATFVAIVPGCGTRSIAWNTALADTECHASDTIVRKLKDSPDTFAVSACGETITYRCDATARTCVAQGPTSAPVTSSGSESPVVPELEGPSTSEPAPAEEPPAEEPPAEEPAAEEAAPEEAAPEESEAPAGEVPEPP